MRPTWDQYGLKLAQAVATRADCTRRQVGSVVLSNDHRVVSCGYNGSYPGGPSCLAGECPRGRHYAVEKDVCRCAQGCPDLACPWTPRACACGNTWPCPDAVDPGSSYDTGPGACHSVHAEANAILYAERSRLVGATLYCTDEPCGGCWKLIRNTPITRVVWPEGEK